MPIRVPSAEFLNEVKVRAVSLNPPFNEPTELTPARALSPNASVGVVVGDPFIRQPGYGRSGRNARVLEDRVREQQAKSLEICRVMNRAAKESL